MSPSSPLQNQATCSKSFDDGQITITIEAIDLSAAGYVLRSLDEVQKVQAARSKKAPKPAPKG